MSSQEFASLAGNKMPYKPSRLSKIFCSPAYPVTGKNGTGTPTPIVATLGGTPAITNGVLTADLTLDTTVTLFQGTKFDFGNGLVFFLEDEVDFTATTEEIGVILQAARGVATGPSSGDTADLVSYLPVLSAKSISISNNKNIIEELTFSSELDMKKAAVSTSNTASLSCCAVDGDPSLGSLQDPGNNFVDFDVVYPNCEGFRSFTAIPQNYQETLEVQAYEQFTVELAVSGANRRVYFEAA